MTERIMKCVVLVPVFLLSASSLILGQSRPSITEIAKQTSKAVVLITVQDKNGTLLGTGSGFVVRPDGIIVTNHHVIDGAFSAAVKTGDGDIYDSVFVVDVDKRKDLAVLRIKALNLPTLTLGDSDKIEVGQHVIAIGNPLGLARSLSDGLVSAVRQLEGYKVIQTTAPISEGSSGGPLLNDSGEVIGITFANLDGQNLNLALPVNYAKALIKFMDVSKSRDLADFNVGSLKHATTTASEASPKPTTLGKIPADDVVEQLKKDTIFYFLDKIGKWTEVEAKQDLGEPMNHRFGYDDARSVISDIYSYADPSRLFRGFELSFNKQTKRMSAVYIYPGTGAGFDSLKRVWGNPTGSVKNPDGTHFYEFKRRNATALVDKKGFIINIGVWNLN